MKSSTFELGLRLSFVYAKSSFNAKTEQRPRVLEALFLKCPFFKLRAPRTVLAYPVKEALRSFLPGDLVT